MRSNASRSMLAVGFYLIFLSICCLFFPEVVLAGLGVYIAPDIFARMCGMIF